MTLASTGISEEWRAIPGYEGMYEVSNCGRVRSLDRVTQASNRRLNRKGKVLSTNPDTHGYLQCRLWKDGKGKAAWVHRLVLEAFVGPGAPDQEGCHNDGDRRNNSPGNLRWDSRAGNMLDKQAHGTQMRGSLVKGAKLTEEIVREIRRLRGALSNSKLAARFGVSRGHIAHIHSGEKWGHVA